MTSTKHFAILALFCVFSLVLSAENEAVTNNVARVSKGMFLGEGEERPRIIGGRRDRFQGRSGALEGRSGAFGGPSGDKMMRPNGMRGRQGKDGSIGGLRAVLGTRGGIQGGRRGPRRGRRMARGGRRVARRGRRMARRGRRAGGQGPRGAGIRGPRAGSGIGRRGGPSQGPRQGRFGRRFAGGSKY